MDIEFDPAKDAINRAKHGLPLAFGALVLADPNHLTVEDRRRPYGERRFLTLGSVKGRVFVAVHTPRGGIERMISVRKANDQETRRYHGAAGQA